MKSYLRTSELEALRSLFLHHIAGLIMAFNHLIMAFSRTTCGDGGFLLAYLELSAERELAPKGWFSGSFWMNTKLMVLTPGSNAGGQTSCPAWKPSTDSTSIRTKKEF